MITRTELNRKQSGSTWDPKSKKYVTYKINVRVNGRRYRQSGFATRKKAEEFVDALKLKKAFRKAGIQAPVGTIRIEQLLDKRRSLITNQAEKQRAARIFEYFLDQHGNPEVNEVRSSHFQHFINARINDGVKPETVNREINLLSAAFRRAPEMFPDELEEYEPPKIPRPRFKRKRREKIITEKEKDRILKWFYRPQGKETEAKYNNRVRVGRMFELAWLLGLRYSEIASLKKPDFRAAERRLTVRRHKTSTTSEIEFLPDAVCNLLNDAVKASRTDFIFTHTGSSPKNFYSLLKAAIESAGLVYGRAEGITFHSCRHSFISRLVRVTDIATAQTFSGHSTGHMVALYSHASAESRQAAMNRLYGNAGTREMKNLYLLVRDGKISFEEFIEQLNVINGKMAA